MTAAEFARPARLDTIGTAPRTVVIEAGAEERTALAARFGLATLGALKAELTLRREGAAFLVTGRVTGRAEQICVVTGEAVPAKIDEAVALRFVTEDAPESDEIEIGADALDTLFLDGGAIDLGEIAAETLALALDPYPRGAGAEAALRAAGVLREDDAGPFGALAALRDKLGGTSD